MVTDLEGVGMRIYRWLVVAVCIVSVFPATDVDAAGALPRGNLLRNGAAEATAGGNGFEIIPPSGWTTTGPFTVVAYSGGLVTYPGAYEGEAVRGRRNYFAGSPAEGTVQSTAKQRVKLPKESLAVIDRGETSISISAALGGSSDQNDAMSIDVEALDKQGSPLPMSLSIEGPDPAERGDETRFHFEHAFALVPEGTRSFDVTMTAQRATFLGSTANNAFADNVRLEFKRAVDLRGLHLTGENIDNTAGFEYILIARVGPVGPCIEGRSVRFFQVKKGTDRLLGEVDVNEAYLASQRVASSDGLDAPPPPGSFYATMGASSEPGISCPAVRSRTFDPF